MAANKATEAVAETELEKASAKKETTTKKTSTKKTAAKTEDGKEEAPKKSTTKKAASKKGEPEVTVTIQYQHKEIVTTEVLEAAKKAFTEANPDVEIKTMDIYVKPEEGVAYYAVNGQGSGDYKITL